MSQIEGVFGVHDTINTNDCEDREYLEWLRNNNLTKFYEPLKEYLGIDSFESCFNLDVTDIPRICQNIPNDVKKQLNISFKDEMILKKALKRIIQDYQQAQPRAQPAQPTQQQLLLRNLTDDEKNISNRNNKRWP